MPTDDEPDYETEIERSKSGSPILRHEPGTRSFELASGDPSLINALGAHLEKHFGGASNWVLHEIVSDLVHVDVHVCVPTKERPFYTLVTSGMAERPMKTPPNARQFEFAELVICLSPDWPGLDVATGTTTADPTHPWRDERNYWPIRWLKTLARFPHQLETWLSFGHTIPTGDPPVPYAPDTQLCCMMLNVNPQLPREFQQFHAGDRDIHLWTLMPLYKEEMQFKLDHGADALNKLFDQHRILPIIDPTRRSAIRRSWWKRW